MPFLMHKPVHHCWVSCREWSRLDMDALPRGERDDDAVKPDDRDCPRACEEFLDMAVRINADEG